MSVVTNAILHMGMLNDDEPAACLGAVNAFFTAGGAGYEQKGFVLVDDPALPKGWYGGSKALECTLAVGAFNHLDLKKLLEHLRADVPWPESERGCVQLIVRGQEDDRFRIIDVNPGDNALPR